MLGCGNSSLPVDLWKDGFKDITAVDISSIVVNKMRERTKLLGVKYVVGDMMELPFPDRHFDCILEKGTLDVLFAENDSPWDPIPEVLENLRKTLDEADRVLQDRGKLLSITFAQPHFRKPLLMNRKYPWSCDVSTFGGEASFEYFVYTMRKGERREEQDDGSLKLRTCSIGETLQDQVDHPDFLSNIQL